MTLKEFLFTRMDNKYQEVKKFTLVTRLVGLNSHEGRLSQTSENLKNSKFQFRWNGEGQKITNNITTN